MRINTSRKITALIFVGIFLLILLCNALTELVADDFAYLYVQLGKRRKDYKHMANFPLDAGTFAHYERPLHCALFCTAIFDAA